MAFAALAMAWFCANAPQTATLHALVWLKSAHQFSHQQRLADSVAGLLAGAKERKLQAVEASKSEKENLPANSAELDIKKVELAAVFAEELSVNAGTRNPCVSVSISFPRNSRAEPPVPPPRSHATV